jgi:hypothetical protein
MIERSKLCRLEDLGLTGRDAMLLLDALGHGPAADLHVPADEMSPGMLAATVLFAIRTATGGLRPGAVGRMVDYERLALRIGCMDPRDVFRVEGWVAGFCDTADNAATPDFRQSALVGWPRATLH